jgi:hypothetical protein
VPGPWPGCDRSLPARPAQFLLHAFLVAASNLKLIDKWREELFEHESDEARQLHFDRKLDAKERRKEIAARRSESWDNFHLMTAEEEESPPQNEIRPPISRGPGPFSEFCE